MVKKNTEYLDKQVRHQINLGRLATSISNDIIKKLYQLERELVNELIQNEYFFSDSKKFQKQRLINTIREINQAHHEQIGIEWQMQFDDLIDYEQQWQHKFISSHFSGAFNLPSSNAIAAIAATPFKAIMEFAKAEDHIEAVFDNRLSVIEGVVNRGILQGYGMDKIIHELLGKSSLNYKDAALYRHKLAMERLVRTAVNHYSNKTHELFAMENMELWRGKTPCVVLDGRTSPFCRSVSGKKYPANFKEFDFPAHINCRTKWLYLPKDERFDVEIPSYSDWLKRQSVEHQNHILGFDKAKAFREGVSLNKFIDNKGRAYTLDQLRKKGHIKAPSAVQQALGVRSYRGYHEDMIKDYEKRGVNYKKYGLTDDEAVVLWAYTQSLHEDLNDSLRSGKNIEYPLVEAMERAISKLPKYKGVVYRGLGLDEEEIDAIIKTGVHIDEGFMSTSISQYVAKEFIGNVLLKIYTKRGREIGELSNIPSEQEVIFNKDAEFIIREVHKDNNQWKIIIQDTPQKK